MSFELLLEQLRRRLAEKKQLDSPKRRRSPRRRLNSLELLETRQLLAADVDIQGTQVAETIEVSVSGSELVVTGIGAEQRYALANIQSLRINAGGQNDTIRVNSSFALSATAAIELIAEEIYVAAGVSITGGDITLTSQGAEDALTVGSNLPIDIADIFSGDRVIEIGNGASLIGDDITLEAERISTLVSPLRPFGGGKKDVDIRIGSATLQGNDISITASAEDRNLDDLVKGDASNLANDALQYAYGKAGLPVPVAVMIRESAADIDLNSTVINATGTVYIEAEASADSTTSAMARVSSGRGPMSAGGQFREVPRTDTIARHHSDQRQRQCHCQVSHREHRIGQQSRASSLEPKSGGSQVGRWRTGHLHLGQRDTDHRSTAGGDPKRRQCQDSCGRRRRVGSRSGAEHFARCRRWTGGLAVLRRFLGRNQS